MRRPTHRKITAAAAALALGFTGVACNDDDNGDDVTTTTVAPGADDGTGNGYDDGTEFDDGTGTGTDFDDNGLEGDNG